MANPTEYEQALKELDALRQQGKISDARYRTMQRRLQAEARRNKVPKLERLRRLLIVLRVVAVVALVLLAGWAIYTTFDAWSST